jgi:hypothetical protein
MVMDAKNVAGLCESGSVMLAELRPILRQWSDALPGVDLTVIIDPIAPLITVLDVSHAPATVLSFTDEVAPVLLDAASAFLVDGLGRLARADADALNTDTRLAVVVDGLGLSLKGVRTDADGSVCELFEASTREH